MKKLSLIAIVLFTVFWACKKPEETAQPPVQDLNHTNVNAISSGLSVNNGTLVDGIIEDNTEDSIPVLSLQNFKPTYPDGNIEINLSYSYADTLDYFRLQITGASTYWTAKVENTTKTDSLLTGRFSFSPPKNLAPGILKFNYQLYKNDSVKTPSQKGEIEILKFPVSGGTINI